MSKLNVYFEDKIIDDYNEDVIFNWYLNSQYGDYRLSMRFCGAGIDEDTYNLDCSSFCAISLVECTSNYECYIETIKKRVEEELSIEFQTYDNVVMICAPDIRREFYIYDESDIDNSIRIAESIIKHSKAVLNIDGDMNIKDYVA